MIRLDFDDVLELVEDEIFFEVVFGTFHQCKVFDTPKYEKTNEGEDTLTMIGVDKTGQQIEFFINRTFQHYGPKLFK